MGLGPPGPDGRPRPIHLQHGAANIQWNRDTEWVRKNLLNRIEKIGEGKGWIEERTGLHELEFIETRTHWFSLPVEHDACAGVHVLNLVEGEEAIVESPSAAFEPFRVHYAETFIVPARTGRSSIGRRRCTSVCNHTGSTEDATMKFDPGIGVVPVCKPLGFRYEPGSFGPQPETRSLDAIRPSLRDPACAGPDPAYAIVMDIGRDEVRAELERRMLLFGAVIYASGKLGDEPVHSQGHVHHVSSQSGWSPPEVYEIWDGAAYVYMQEYAADDPGRCYAILAKPGDAVVVPPAWAHAAMSADPSTFMALGALCDRESRFDYDAIRKRKGLAWYPIVTPNAGIEWVPNPCYKKSSLDVRGPKDYAELGLVRGCSLYEQAVRDLDRFAWVSHPALCADVWKHFEP